MRHSVVLFLQCLDTIVLLLAVIRSHLVFKTGLLKVFIFTHYKDVKRDTKCGTWGGLGVVRDHPWSLEIAPFDRAHTNSY